MPRQIVLVSRPRGLPTPADFGMTETDRTELADGQVRIRNLFMSVDPYMRGRMTFINLFRGGNTGTMIVRL